MCDDGWEQIRTVIRCKCHAKRGCEWFRPIRQCQPENEFEPTTQPVPAGGTCELLQNNAVGTWDCSDDNNVKSRCKLNCKSGYVPSSRHNARRCRCSSRKQLCHWTREDYHCLPENDIELTTYVAPVDYESERCEALFESDSGPDDEFPNGTWKCKVNGEKVSYGDHNMAGARCVLECDGNLEAIRDGRRRRCRYKESKGALEWSGRHRICRTHAQNARILQEEAYELELKLQRRAEKERKKMEELTILTPRSRHFPEIQFDVGLNPDYYQEEIQEKLESRENHDSRKSKNEIKKLTKDGETYVHGFDFLQKIQHWMWNLGLFNKE